MIVTRTWLQEWIDIEDVSAQQLDTIFNKIGLEVAEYKKLSIPANVVVGRILSCKKHPNADKLNLCEVDVGNEKLQIVCGAKNVVHAKYVAVAKIGAVLPGDFQIKPAKLRGVQSYGMICSSTELGLPKMEDGIMILDDSIGELITGKELREYDYFSDDVFELELTANRGDCLSILGVARELSAALGRDIKEIHFENEDQMQIGIGRLVQFKPESDIQSNVAYKAFTIANSGFNPLLIRLRVALTGENFKNSAEELAFYVTHATGVITHIYGYSFFEKSDNAIRIKKDEQDYDAVYGSKKGSIIGVIQYDDSKPTKMDERFILEASYIDPEYIAQKMYQTPVKSDWTYYRSSRGSNPKLSLALHYAKKTIHSYYEDAKFYAGRHEIEKEIEREAIKIGFEQLFSIIGSDLDKNRIVDILKNLGFVIQNVTEEYMIVKAPLFRHDIHNIQDIAEEIVRIYGIDNIRSKPLQCTESNRLTDAYRSYKAKFETRERALAAGFFETVSYLFTSKEFLQKYGFVVVSKNLDIINPITKELDTLRTSIVPNILQQVSQNVKNGFKIVKLFEIGSVFDQNRNESIQAVFVHSGYKKADSVINHGKPDDIDFAHFIDELAGIFGEFELRHAKPHHKLVHPYQVAKIIKEKKELGRVYKLHIEAQEELDLPTTYIAEIDFDATIQNYPQAKEYSIYQRSIKDLSLLIDKDTPYEEVAKVLEENLPDFVRRFYPVDIYESEELGDKKSLTLRFVLQSFDKTLTDEDIATVIESILSILQEKLGVELR